MSNYKNMSSTTDERRKDECDSLRTVTFFGVTLSTAAALICVVGVPMFYSQMQQIQSTMQSELDFCKSRAGNIWHEVSRTQILASVHPRTARAIHSGKSTLRRRYADSGYEGIPQAGRSSYSGPSVSYPAAVPPSSGGCCGCGHSPSGPPGPPGPDGQPGNDGNQGPEGRPGQDAPIPHPQPPPHWCFDCPPGPRGEPGSAGPKGPNGNEGMPGRDGKSPPPGPPGPLGAPGPAGENGQPGEQGHPGKDGIIREVNKGPGPIGPPGTPGLPGERGQPGNDGHQGYAGPQGAPGDVGTDGSPGKPGSKGEDGKRGDKGPTGSCDHCAQPRTPPGY